MPSVDKHAWTHRLKAFGGSDPISPDLESCKAFYGLSQSITGSTELRLDTFSTNNPDIFELDVTSTPNPSGVLIKKVGFYAMFAMLTGSAGTAKGIYLQTQPAASYPTFGSEDHPGTSATGTPFNFNDTHINNTVANLHTFTFRRVSGAAFLPFRTIVAATLPAANYTVSFSSLIIVRISRISAAF